MREKPPVYPRHDQLFKQLLHTFFAEFLEVFFPEVHKEIDVNEIRPVSEEMYTDLFEGERRQVDVVIETTLKGDDTVIIIHVEPQSYVEANFHERMYHYFNLLYWKYRKPILPIAVFSYGKNYEEQDHFSISFPFFRVLSFQFLMLELRKKNWREYLETNNPVAAALLSKMGYAEKEKVQVKKEFLRMIMNMKLDAAKSAFIIGFFERYLTLNKREEEELMTEIEQMPNEEREHLMQLSNSWIEKGMEKGRVEEKKNIVVEMLKQGLAIDLISEITKLDREAIEDIKRAL